MYIRLCCQDQDPRLDLKTKTQDLRNFQDQDRGKTFYFKTNTFLVFLYQNLGSLIQCQHKQQHDQQTIYILYVTS